VFSLNKEDFKRLLAGLDLTERVRVGISTPGGTQHYFGKFFSVEAEEPGLPTGPTIKFVIEDDVPKIMGWYLYMIDTIEQWPSA